MAFILEKSGEGTYIATDSNNYAYSFEVYPKHRNFELPKILTKIVAESLKERIISTGYNPKPRHLLGRCRSNAKCLFDNLRDRDYKPRLVVGCNKEFGSSKDSVHSFKRDRNAHQWVEVNSYICEVCSESNCSRGKMYVSRRKPDNYYGYFTLLPRDITNLGISYVSSNNIEMVEEYVKENYHTKL